MNKSIRKVKLISRNILAVVSYCSIFNLLYFIRDTKCVWVKVGKYSA